MILKAVWLAHYKYMSMKYIPKTYHGKKVMVIYR